MYIRIFKYQNMRSTDTDYERLWQLKGRVCSVCDQTEANAARLSQGMIAQPT